MRPTRAPRPHNREGMWYLVRRVPKAFAHLDQRGLVRISTEIAVAHDPKGRQARAAVAALNDGLETFWQQLADGRSENARAQFQAVQARARALGFPYRTASELSEGPLAEILTRLQTIMDKDAADDPVTVAALAGGLERPVVRLSTLLDEFEELNRAQLGAMSPDQVRRWRNPKRRALDNLMQVIGDKPLEDVSRADAVAFRKWWQDRILGEDIDIGTANKDFGHVARMLNEVDIAHQLGLQAVFSKLRIAGAVRRSRSAFTAAHVQTCILADGALGELNDEARRLIYLIADTGLRLSEAANLLPETIHLSGPVPYVEVLPIGRKLKTDHSSRQIPLVGAALAAMRAQPQGFPRYRDRAASLSAVVNKVLESRKLLPTGNHSLYSLRHTFEDRLTAVEAPEKVIAALMGHKWIRPKYGSGPSLEQKAEWLEKIAFKPPENI